jgi:hypothetical protein
VALCLHPNTSAWRCAYLSSYVVTFMSYTGSCGTVRQKKLLSFTGFLSNLLLTMVKAKLPLGLTKHHAMKTYRGSRSIAPRIL